MIAQIRFALTLAALGVLSGAGDVLLQAQATEPTRLLACESRDMSCGKADARRDTTWTFDGTQGQSVPVGGGMSSVLVIEKLDSSSMVVRRTDPSGLAATYAGTIHGAVVSGTVQYSWRGHEGYPASGVFSAEFQNNAPVVAEAVASGASASLPGQLLVCENGGACNVAWTLNGAGSTGVWFGQNSIRSNLIILKSAPDDLMIRRVDRNGRVLATYSGSQRGDHYGGIISVGGNGRPGSWTATIPQTTCDPSDPDARQAMNLGMTALMFNRNQDALSCYTLAAKLGNTTAQWAVGTFYYQGHEGVPQDYTLALFWLRKAADQGMYGAQRTVEEMYTAGMGTKPDPVMAGIYKARADEQKHDLERRQDSVEKQLDRQANILSSAVLGFSLGLAFY